MNHAHARCFLLALVTAVACDPVKLGEQHLEGESSSAADDATVTGDTTPAEGGLGAPCDHGRPESYVPESKLVTFPALDCAGMLCAYVDISEPPDDACSNDAECNAADPATGRFTCDVPTATCRIAHEYFAARSMCSQFCESDDECMQDGATECATGFTCVPLSSIGDAACRPMCACRDDLDFVSSQALVEECSSGESPGCTQHPGQGLCPD